MKRFSSTSDTWLIFVLANVWSDSPCYSFTLLPQSYSSIKRTNSNSIFFKTIATQLCSSFNDNSDNFFEDDEDLFASLSPSSSTSTTSLSDENTSIDISGATTRQFNLGYDIQIAAYAGALGFDEVIDWEYFDNPGSETRNIVEPPPLDPTKPKRTRSSSGSVIRIFRGELLGSVASSLRSRGLEYRVLIKEYSGEMAEELASQELDTMGKLQSQLCTDVDDNCKNGNWANSASSRYLLGMDTGDTRKDDVSLTQLMESLNGQKASKFASSKSLPLIGILGRLNLSEYENDPDLDPNEWYRALGVPGPKANSIWIVYEYAGLSTFSSYAQPPLLRRAKIPPKKGMFGNLVLPPPLPPWDQRASYVLKVLQKALEGLATLHENGVAHRSIGRSSIVLSTAELDKSTPANIYTTNAASTNIKFSDFGFAGIISESAQSESFRRRAKTFGIEIAEPRVGLTSSMSIQETNFAIAEDLHAIGFVFLGILLTTLAEPKSELYRMPKTDEDSLQRLLGEIFANDMKKFREYCEEEEIWDNVVQLMDEKDGAGWELLEKLCFARERVRDIGKEDGLQLLTARGLLSSPLFQ